MLILKHLLILLLDVYLWIIIAAVMSSWLIVFGVLNTKNKFVYRAVKLLNDATRPPIAFLQRYIPPVGGIDLTPMVLIFGIYILQGMLR